MPSATSKRLAPMLELQRAIVDSRRVENNSDEKQQQQRRTTQADQAARLNMLRQSNLFCDVHIQVGKSSNRRMQFAAHKILLTAVSEYFLELFCGMPKLNTVYFPHLDASAFDWLLSYSYFARIELTIEQVSRFLRTAALLRFDNDCIERCASFLRDNFTVDNVLEVRQLLPTFDAQPAISDLRSRANAFIRAHVTELIEHILTHASSSTSTKHAKTHDSTTHEAVSQAAADDSTDSMRPSAIGVANGDSDAPVAASVTVLKLRLRLSSPDQLASTDALKQNQPAPAAYRELAGLVLRWIADFAASTRSWARQLDDDRVLRLALDETNRIIVIEVPSSAKLTVSPSGQCTSSSASLSNWDADSDVESVRCDRIDSDLPSGVEATDCEVTNGTNSATSQGHNHKSTAADGTHELASMRLSSSSRGSLGPSSLSSSANMSAGDVNEFESAVGDGSNGQLETCTVAVHVEPEHPDRFACLAMIQSKFVLMSVCVDMPKENVDDADDTDQQALSVREHNGIALQNGNGHCSNEHGSEITPDVSSLVLEEPHKTASRHSSSSGSASPTRSSSAPHRRGLTLEPLAEMLDSRCGHACVALSGGHHLAALGGYNRDRCLSSVELFDLSANSWTPLGSMRSSRARFGACLIGDLLIACGGSDGSADLHSCEVLKVAGLNVDGNANPTSACRSSSDDVLPSGLRFDSIESMNYARSSHAVAALDDRAYVVGGNADNMDLNVLELYDVVQDEWIVGPSLRSERSQPAVCADANRNCLYALGGSRQGSPLSTIELYDPREPAWHLLDCRLPSARRGAAAVCNSDGLVYVVGGHGGSQALRTVELFDPRNRCVLPMRDLNLARANVACCLLKSRPAAVEATDAGTSCNDLLIALGGFSGKQFLGSIEFYDSEAQRWSIYKPAPCAEMRTSPSAFSLRRPHESGSCSQATSMSVSMSADADAETHAEN